MLNKKIALIQLPSPYLLVEKWIVPLHLYYLKAYLNKKGFENVEVINLAGIKDYKGKIPANCDYYGISVFTPQYSLAKEVSTYIKKNFNGVIVGGGYHITALAVESVKNLDIDIAVIGEGEHTLFEIVSGNPLKEIAGIVYKENSEEIVNPPRQFHQNIDDFPFPDVGKINFNEYHGMVLDKKGKRYEMPIITSRGCPFICAFCASSKLWKRIVRFHSAEYVIDTLNRLYSYGINDFRFVDDNFDLNKSRLKIILEHLKKLGSRWGCGMRSANVNPEIISLMKESGVTEISLGIESGSNKILELINKNETVEDHIRAIKIIKEYDVSIKGFLMSGLPGEDQSTVNETIRFIKEQPVDYYTLSTFTPFPGTDIWECPERFNYVLDKTKDYDSYAFLSKDRINTSVAKDVEKRAFYRQQLLDACADIKKDTIVRSFNVARNLNDVVSWKEAF